MTLFEVGGENLPQIEVVDPGGNLAGLNEKSPTALPDEPESEEILIQKMGAIREAYEVISRRCFTILVTSAPLTMIYMERNNTTTGLISSFTMTQKMIVRPQKVFCSHFGSPSELSDLKVSIAPGRVNLIGEHVDYCDGFVLPICIPLYTVVIGRCSNEEGVSEYFSSTYNQTAKFGLTDDPEQPKNPAWAKYVEGVLTLKKITVGVTAVIHSQIPPGSGLSSSAALEVATLLFIEQFSTDPPLPRLEAALLCQKAENEFAGVPCGIMDQFVISLATHSCALKIDCRSLECDPVPIAMTSQAVFLVTNSGVKHALAGGEYAKRRANVERAVQLLETYHSKAQRHGNDESLPYINDILRQYLQLGVHSWRDVSLELIRSKSESFAEDKSMLYNATHVVDEIARTLRAANALLDNNAIVFGKLMTESHESLRDKYQVSCKELDQLVSLALETDGVFGSRMTGGGFGGCTVTLVRRDFVEQLKQHISKNYEYGVATFHECVPVRAAEIPSIQFLMEEKR